MSRFWSVEGQSVKKATVSESKIALDLSNGKTLVISAAGFLHVNYDGGPLRPEDLR